MISSVISQTPPCMLSCICRSSWTAGHVAHTLSRQDCRHSLCSQQTLLKKIMVLCPNDMSWLHICFCQHILALILHKAGWSWYSSMNLTQKAFFCLVITFSVATYLLPLRHLSADCCCNCQLSRMWVDLALGLWIESKTLGAYDSLVSWACRHIIHLNSAHTHSVLHAVARSVR